jgi:hypothetical protein
MRTSAAASPFERNRLVPERAAKAHVRENPAFEPVFLPPMVLDPIDSEAADDFDHKFDEGSD